MGSLRVELRRPQFSEEVAWLPAWLQQHHAQGQDQGESFDVEDQTTLHQTFTNISTGKDATLSSPDEGRYKSCHLLLSGDDNSPASLAPSFGNQVVDFHLHLSAGGTSQNMPSSLMDTPQAWRIVSNNVLSMKQSEVSAGQEERENQFKMDYNVGGVNFPSMTSQQEISDNICPQFVAKAKDVKMNHEENIGYPSVSDINEAVEFSIAASEALVIHNMVKNLSCTKSSAAVAVLEVSLRVKQARLEGLEDFFHCSAEDIDETYILSDLDESNMAEAYEDVGLSVSNLDNPYACASAISQAKGRLISENHYDCDDKYKYECHGAPKVDFDDISTDVLDMANQEERVFPVVVLDVDRQRKLIDDPNVGLNTFILASHNDSVRHCSALENSDVSATAKGVNFAMENITSFPHQANLNSSPPAWSYGNETKRDEKLTIVGPDRFQSRWLGGWMWKKEINSSALVENNNAKIVAKFLVGETSYLSESADIAPDENSFVQKQDKGSHMASQSSIPSEALHNRVDEAVLFSQDVVRSSSLSSVDPLCSVVPCSISSENDWSPLVENPNDEVDAGKCYRPASEYCNVNLQRTSNSSTFVHKEREAFSTINCEVSQPTVRRQLTSLRTYSMLLPQCSTFFESDNIYFSQLFPSEYSSGLLSAKQNMACKRGSIELPSLHKCSTAGEIEKNNQTLVVQNVLSDLMNQKRSRDETAKDGTRLQVHKEEDRCSPHILNQGKRSHLHASKETLQDLGGEKNPQQSALQKSYVDPQSKNLQKEAFQCKVDCDFEVPARKRVCFSEFGIQLLRKNDIQKLQSACKGSMTRSGKRLRHSNPMFKPVAQEIKKRQTNGLAKIVKRMIFRNVEFLLTGFTSQKEKEIESVIRKYGGIVLADVPSPPSSRGKRSSRLKLQQLPIVLCSRKLETTKFLYGCAVNAYILNVNWLTDSIAACCALPPDKYVIIGNYVGEKCTVIGRPLCRNNHNYIFDRVGVVLHGKHSFCNRIAKVVKHGGGQVFKSLQRLVQNLNAEKISVGTIIVEDESMTSRHLKHCASEGKIPMMPASWIINSLHAGKRLPFLENKHYSPLPTIKILEFPSSMALSQEI
ncbi:uncharacterized protein LOC130795400 isoform X1 [Actinidia eriantha]|uniref:uncharacterized protein LOC130795400 isoform X1 n=1 Tax=Actinidia eriantha TaxID=165200 RepID=UPI0025848297|nr:uncharacterized protein LOC130795400 isoform X1 [Actinidia eriantha]